MNERSVIPLMLHDLPRIAREEGWNGATILLVLHAIATAREIENNEREMSAPADVRRN